jgi:hypothetical protein
MTPFYASESELTVEDGPLKRNEKNRLKDKFPIINARIEKRISFQHAILSIIYLPSGLSSKLGYKAMIR